MDGASDNRFNGNSLSSLAGAKRRVEEHISFAPETLADAIALIKQIRGTGQLSLSFVNGGLAGTAEWRTGGKR